MKNTWSRRSLVSGMLSGLSSNALGMELPESRRHEIAATIELSEQYRFSVPDGQQYLVQVARPRPVLESNQLALHTRTAVPLYVLDGGEMFPIVVGLARLMQVGGSLPPPLVVGIAYADADLAQRTDRRSYDFTPTRNGRRADVLYGGANRFRTFIIDTIRPFIEGRFDVDHARSVLLGHSLGGLFALDTAVFTPGLFASILALSPSLWFDNALVFHRLAEALAKGAHLPRIVTLVGDREQELFGPQFNMTGNVEMLGQLAAAANRSNDVIAGVLKDTTHNTIQGPGFTHGLRILFDPHPPAPGAGLFLRCVSNPP